MKEPQPIIEFFNVTKRYPGFHVPAIRNLSLKIYSGEKIGLVGANGSGKTTLIRLLLNFIKPDSGKISIFGSQNLEKAANHIGYVSENQEGLENFTPRELFYFAAKMYGMDSRTAKIKTSESLQFSGLTAQAEDLIEGFSKGMAQRAFISAAILHQPEILLLDEPMSGLDGEARKEVGRLLKKLPAVTMIYASHNLEEIEEFSSSVVILHKGEMIRKINLEEDHEDVYILEIDPSVKDHLENFSDLSPGIKSVHSGKLQLQLTAKTNQIEGFLGYCRSHNITIHRLRSRSILEDSFLNYVKK